MHRDRRDGDAVLLEVVEQVTQVRGRPVRWQSQPVALTSDDGWGVEQEGRLGDEGPVGENQLDLLGTDLSLEVVSGAFADQLASVDHRDAVRQAVGLLEVLRGQEHRDLVRHQLGDGVPDRLPAAQVEARRGLVEEEHLRARHQAHGQVDPPPHAAGVVLHTPIAGTDEVEPLEQLIGAASRAGTAEAREPAHHPEVLLPGEQHVDRGVLAGQADGPAYVSRGSHDVVTGDRRAPGVGPGQGRENADGGRLARPVGTEEGEHRAALDAQVEAVEDHRRAVGLAEADSLEDRVLR